VGREEIQQQSSANSGDEFNRVFERHVDGAIVMSIRFNPGHFHQHHSRASKSQTGT
jgi:hypothetical protein